MNKGIKVVIAGGGTGGHLFPGVAIAEEFIESHQAEILFVGVDGDLEKKILIGGGFRFAAISAGGVIGTSPHKKLVALWKQLRGITASLKILREFSPAIVLGMGGYASVPCIIAAKLLAIPTAVAEQNSIPGVANRLLGRVVKKVFISMAMSQKYFPPNKVLLTGNPIRKGFLTKITSLKEKRHALVLVCGGSQGARAINEAMMAGAQYLKQSEVEIIHQCGQSGDIAALQGAYAKAQIKAQVVPFIDDMPGALCKADLVISRAGATTIAELLVAGKPAILVPFPFAASDHQRHNAMNLADCGAAMVVEERELQRDGSALALKIKGLLAEKDKRELMAHNARALGKPSATADVVAECIKLARR